MPSIPTLDDLRRFAVSRSLFRPTTLGRAVERLGFIQADPIRAPARAQDLVLRQRVARYHAGDLERRYVDLGLEEDFFVNYGFVTPSVHMLMHPRPGLSRWPAAERKRADAVLAFVGARGVVHPRDVDEHFAHGRVTNYWGGLSNATTHLLTKLHYLGLVRVVGRDGGVRLYACRAPLTPPGDAAERTARLDALIDVVVRKYAPLPSASLATVVGRLRYAVPQWRRDLKAALRRAVGRLSHARVENVDWYWPSCERLDVGSVRDEVRLLAPFDPVVWDRRRFERFWGWAYRFEAYTPVAKRRFGYYALPLLWRERVIGWTNVTVRDGRLQADAAFVAGRPPRDRRFRPALDEELARMRAFLRVGSC